MWKFKFMGHDVPYIAGWYVCHSISVILAYKWYWLGLAKILKYPEKFCHYPQNFIRSIAFHRNTDLNTKIIESKGQILFIPSFTGTLDKIFNGHRSKPKLNSLLNWDPGKEKNCLENLIQKDKQNLNFSFTNFCM